MTSHLKARSPGKPSIYLLKVWSYFCCTVVKQCPSSVHPDVWKNWLDGTYAPSYRLMSTWCSEMGLSIDSFIRTINTYTTNPQTSGGIAVERRGRQETLKSLMIAVAPVYRDLIFAYLQNSVPDDVRYDKEYNADNAVDFRAKKSDVNAMRQIRWSKLFLDHNVHQHTPIPAELKARVTAERWREWTRGESFPSIPEAGFVGEALGLDYDSVLAIYYLGDSDSKMTPHINRSLQTLRPKFNKSWSKQTLDRVYTPERKKQLRLAASIQGQATRRTRLSDYRAVIEARLALAFLDNNTRQIAIAREEMSMLNRSEGLDHLPLPRSIDDLPSSSISKARETIASRGGLPPISVVPVTHVPPPPPPPPAPESLQALPPTSVVSVESITPIVSVPPPPPPPTSGTWVPRKPTGTPSPEPERYTEFDHEQGKYVPVPTTLREVITKHESKPALDTEPVGIANVMNL